MQTIRHHPPSPVLLIPFLLLLNCCSLLIDGPFNQDGVMVPELLYANNGTNLVTFWDEQTQAYRTFDQEKNFFLSTPVFNIERPEDSTNYVIGSSSVIPLTRLDEHGLGIQQERGCIACHRNKFASGHSRRVFW